MRNYQQDEGDVSGGVVMADVVLNGAKILASVVLEAFRVNV